MRGSPPPFRTPYKYQKYTTEMGKQNKYAKLYICAANFTPVENFVVS